MQLFHVKHFYCCSALGPLNLDFLEKLFHVKQSDEITTRIHVALRASLVDLGLDLPLDRTLALAEAIAWLGDRAFRLGLTNYPTPTELFIHLIAPLLKMLTPAVAGYLASPVLDFGAGSGAVGLSLAILRPDLQVILADRRVRVVQFLDLCIAHLQLPNCQSLQVDLANPPADLCGSVGTVLIRAFGPAEQALQYAARLIRPDGCVVLWHQAPSPPPPDNLAQVKQLTTNLESLALTIYCYSG
jgi:16S rRNA G527 N7-methylase RsmG